MILDRNRENMIHNLEEKQTQKWQVMKLEDKEVKELINYLQEKKNVMRDMEAINEESSGTSRDKKYTWKEKFTA